LDALLDQQKNPFIDLKIESDHATAAHVIKAFKISHHPWKNLDISGWANHSDVVYRMHSFLLPPSSFLLPPASAT
jgi:hypothetical protein